MSEHIWTIRDADGGLRGVGMIRTDAVANADIDDDIRHAFEIGCGSPHNGYTLTREPLTPPTPASAPVVVLDADGEPVTVYMVLNQHNTPFEQSQDKDHAESMAHVLASEHQQLRVMRVCLQEVSDA